MRRWKNIRCFRRFYGKVLFWFYLEHRDIRPVVKEEKKPPCSRLYIPDKKSLLFEVSYHENRINFEVYHALTDGTGAMHFLEELVQNYLILAPSGGEAAAHRAGGGDHAGAIRRRTAFLSIIPSEASER